MNVYINLHTKMVLIKKKAHLNSLFNNFSIWIVHVIASFKKKIYKENSADYRHLMFHDSSLCHNDTMEMSSICIIRIFFQFVKKKNLSLVTNAGTCYNTSRQETSFKKISSQKWKFTKILTI